MSKVDTQTSTPRLVYRHLLVATFALGIFLPLLDWRFELDSGLALTENRTLAVAPNWPKTGDEWQALPSALQSYWNDAFGFRGRLLHWNAIAKYRLGVSPVPAVVIGARGFLFFAGEESFEQHRGLRPFREEELANWARELEARRQWLASRGAHFLFTFAPDKQSIYPDLVPARYGPFARDPADELVAYLRAHTQVDVLDLRGPVRAARAAGAVFETTDSHWSDRGAVAGYGAIVERLRTWFPQLAARPQASFTAHRTLPWNGDLSSMLPGLLDVVKESDEQWQPTPGVRSRPLLTADGYRPPVTWLYGVYVTPEPSHAPRAVFFHDSFLLAPDERISRSAPPAGTSPPPESTLRLRELLAEQFSRSVFTWQYEFDPKLIEEEHPDVVVEECAERKLRLGPLGAAPVVASP